MEFPTPSVSSGENMSFPRAGEILEDFQLLEELGRGLESRVFLALTLPRQAPVVVKVVSRRKENSGLRPGFPIYLPHNHIVPLQEIRDLDEPPIQIFLSPYLGGLTWSRVLEVLAPKPPAERTGQDILVVLETSVRKIPAPLPGESLEKDILGQSTYVDALCFLGACLADALAHVHKHGLVHLDLKPSNLLVAADARPMLLDLLPGRQPISSGDTASNGPWPLLTTPLAPFEYQAPEQRAAVENLKGGKPAGVVVDGRADIYALGMLLYTALGGPSPDPSRKRERRGPERPGDNLSEKNPDSSLGRHPSPFASGLSRANPQVSPGLVDILQHCLEPEAGNRYQGAAALAEDLRRHRENRPLLGVKNRLPERWHKWRRRNPRAGRRLLIGLLGACIAILVIFFTMNFIGEQRREVEKAYLEGRALNQQGMYKDAISRLTQAQNMVKGLPGNRDLADNIEYQLRFANRAFEAQKLALVAYHLRFFALAEDLPPSSLKSIDGECRTAWDERVLLTTGAALELPDPIKADIQFNLFDLAVLWPDIRLLRAQPAQKKKIHHDALEGLREVEKLMNPMQVLDYEMAQHLAALGKKDEARQLEITAAKKSSKSPWENMTLGRFWLRQGKLKEAQHYLELAVDAAPLGFVAHYCLGMCYLRSRQFPLARQEFSNCLTQIINPEIYFNRGRACAGAGLLDLAHKDFDRAIKLAQQAPENFHLGAFYFHRGMLEYQKSRFPDAVQDFNTALEKGADPARVHFQLAMIHLVREEWAAARAGLEDVLRYDPDHKDARRLLEELPP